MTQTEIIEDASGTTAEVVASDSVELAISASEGCYFLSDEDNAVTVSLVLTPRQARMLARQLLAQADAAEYGDEG